VGDKESNNNLKSNDFSKCILIKKLMVFRGVYNETRNVFSSLIILNDDELNAIENEAKKDELKAKTNRHLFLISAASLAIIISPYIIVRLFNSLDIITSYLSLKKGHYLQEYTDVTNISLGAGGFSILVYFFLFPDFWRFRKLRNANSRLFSAINKTQPNYIFSSFMGCYIVFGFILYLVQLNSPRYADDAISLIKYYLILPLSFISVFMLMFLIVLILRPFMKYFDSYSHSSNNRIELSFLLLKSLHKLKDYDSIYLIPIDTSRSIVGNLERASEIIREYPERMAKGSLNTKVIDAFSQSANFIDQIIIDFQTASKLGSQNIKDRIISNVNIILAGNLLDLPKSEIETNNIKIARKVKLYQYFLLALYLTLPIVTVILMNVLFDITFTEYNQSLLKILYIIWAFVGIFSNPIILNSENKEIIRDIVKSWFGKG
jgi:hypothetical protein